MTDSSSDPASPEAVESLLRADLAHGDSLIGTIIPIMRHLVANEDHSVFSEEVVARTRAMLEDVARQLLVARGDAAGQDNPQDLDGAEAAVLVDALCADAGLLAHVHALALEWQLTERVHARLGLDPVLSPLLQALIASNDEGTAASAMNLLAAQARFTQTQRRMQLPLGELPADQLHAALVALGRHFDGDSAAAERLICESFDEARSRLGLMSRLVLGMGGGATAALALDHAGVSLFLTALAIATGQDRSLATLSTNEGQLARLALALSASGLKPQSVEAQFMALHPEITLPSGFENLGPDRAAAILSAGTRYPG